MSPEQARLEALDARSDVYALGAIAYQLLSGRLPHPRLSTATLFEALVLVRREEPPRLASVQPGTHVDLDNVVMKALAQRARGVIPTDFPSIGTPWLLQALAALYGRSGITRAMPPIANVVISNVPGPQVPLYACGREMLEYAPFVPLAHGMRTGVAILSYNRRIAFGVTGDWDGVPDLDVLADGIARGIDELVAASAPAATSGGKRRKR